MKFRMVWLGPEDEPQGQSSVPEKTAATLDDRNGVRYDQRGTEMVRREPLANGRFKIIPLANFSARIVRDLVFDDGEHRRRAFVVEAELDGRRIEFPVSASEFGRMGWILDKLGPHAILYPGQQQHARAAIQYLSSPVRQERIFARMGWLKHGSDWVYLHAAGALGAAGPLTGLELQLPTTLRHYRLAWPEDPGTLLRAVRSSLRCLSIAPDCISFPLLAAVYRAPMGKLDFSMFLTGKTGLFKTALATVCQQHFGAGLDASHLPASFASTAQAMQCLASQAKDALLVVDDFVPTGRHSDSALENAAEQLFRSAGNHQGRSRLNGSGRPSVAQPPRALLLATGERVPQGQSIRSRLLIVEVGAGDVSRDVLSACQSAAAEGLFALAMSGFISWIAGRYEELQQRLHHRVQEIRSHGRGREIHARLPGALAELHAVWEIFLDFAFETGAISRSEKHALAERNEKALDQLGALQAKYQISDPAVRFVALVKAALASGVAHIAGRNGQAPDTPERWGWGKPTGRVWLPQGTRIGWVAGHDLFLEPAASYEVAQQMAGAERLPVSAQTLRHRLRQNSLLASVDAGRQMLLVRRTLEGVPKQVLHIKARDFMS
jgi:hypothetical protein